MNSFIFIGYLIFFSLGCYTAQKIDMYLLMGSNFKMDYIELLSIFIPFVIWLLCVFMESKEEIKPKTKEYTQYPFT
jgi:hypothetical protein